MRDWDANRLARAAGARLVFRPDAEEAPPGMTRDAASPGPLRVSIDSRAVAPGDLFVGLRGERSDGGEFAAQALQAGAWGTLVAPEHALAVAAMAEAAGAGLGYQGVVLADPNPLAGLQALARSWLSELRSAGARVVAITGSTGKTSTKDILAALLVPHLHTVASPANFNTEIGLPLAILAAPADTEALVLEMAMRGSGQIAELTAIAEPEVGVIVNVGPVHLELLGSLEAIAAAKAELIAGLAPGATAIVPAGEPLLGEHLRDDVHTVTFGPGGDVQLADHSPDGSVCVLAGASAGRSEIPGPIGAPAVSPLSGRDRANTDPVDAVRIVLRPSFSQAHNLRNLLAAVAAARALGVTPGGEVTVRFSALRGERMRLSEEIVLIDDCYNANPMSMRSAIDDLAETAPGRRVAVLGDMLELGADERRFHREIGAHAAARGVDVLVTVGPLAAEMAPAFARAGAHSVADAPAAAELLARLLAPGDTVLVKGSRGVGLERVGQALLAREALAPPEIPDGVRAGTDGPGADGR
jgi:UDP-N-acetylmuramoyl-tripeptide--D-alanyl-D-alanine ligase